VSAVRAGAPGGRVRSFSPPRASDSDDFETACEVLVGAAMSRKPASYEEILERTVPDPSGAYRPSRDERRRATHLNDAAIHPMTPHEHVLAKRIRTALQGDVRIGDTAESVEIVIQGGIVYLTGLVAGPGTIAVIEDIIGEVHGVERIISDLVIPNRSEGER
jgi:hypothetical protein